MEALVAILIEAILAPLFALFGAIASLLAGVISSFVTLIVNGVMALFSAKAGSAADSRGEATKGDAPKLRSPDRRQRSRLRRWFAIAVLSLTGLILIALTAINIWFLDDVVRYLLRQQQQRTGVVIMAKHISGNLFTGRFRADGVSVHRRDHPAGLIDLTIERVDAHVAVWRVLANPRVVESLTVAGVRGRFERGVGGAPPSKNPSPLGGVEITVTKNGVTIENRERRERRTFRINTLDVRDGEFIYADHTRKTPLVIPVTLTSLTAQPLRSDWAVFDVLFRSNATGTIAGSPLTIATSGDDFGRETQWHMDALPVTVLAGQIGGPFTVLSEGTADIRVVDQWQRSDDARAIVMDWSVVLHDVRAEMPESPSPLLALLGEPIVAFINDQSASIPLSFQVAIDESRFQGAASAEAVGMWDMIADSVAASFAEKLGIETEAVKDIGGRILEGAKDVLDRWRKTP